MSGKHCKTVHGFSKDSRSVDDGRLIYRYVLIRFGTALETAILSRRHGAPHNLAWREPFPRRRPSEK